MAPKDRGSNVRETALRLLDSPLHPVPRFRIIRDILHVPNKDSEYRAAREEVCNTRFAKELGESQEKNGTWGRFHTQDTRAKKKFPTTEKAIERALAVGLDNEDRILKRTTEFIEAHLQGGATWSDHPEKHDNPALWEYAIKAISAANLSLIDRDHPLVAEQAQRFAGAAKEAFRTENYDRDKELQFHVKASGIESRSHGSCLTKYGLLLLSSKDCLLPGQVETRLLDFVLHKEDGIYYTYGGCLQDPPLVRERHFPRWLAAHEILSRFVTWPALAEQAVRWIWEQQNENGLWDFGGNTPRDNYFPLSDNWKRKTNRAIDCSVRTLILLNRFYEKR
ncbi:MAG: hypothetical protein QGI68_12000 [Pseudomonadales bacterium]|jgi:hypothetical protein|nr:hypothetical protein [Pseudomonadales bacterium]MDP7596274.1 hypothetical protein [Pseudomonadales bacterium]HJN51999.1 hypothetical protein [Pseudomonadales bacterium]|tara:strand:+ start:1305 stop:2312 length:1008 start_codon:yes stop_codon:yes gene_type:complete